MLTGSSRKFWCIRVENGKEMCGSDNNLLFDLKTVQGVKNRMTRNAIRLKKGQWHIYSYTNAYDKNTWVLKDTILL